MNQEEKQALQKQIRCILRENKNKGIFPSKLEELIEGELGFARSTYYYFLRGKKCGGFEKKLKMWLEKNGSATNICKKVLFRKERIGALKTYSFEKDESGNFASVEKQEGNVKAKWLIDNKNQIKLVINHRGEEIVVTDLSLLLDFAKKNLVFSVEEKEQ